jgi:hypothetical protein
LGSDDEDETLEFAQHQLEMMEQYGAAICAFGMYYDSSILNKRPHREPEVTGYDWVMRSLNDPEECFNMFRMNRELFYRLHDLLLSTYGLQSTWHMSSIDALAMFLWIVGAPQSIRQAVALRGPKKLSVGNLKKCCIVYIRCQLITLNHEIQDLQRFILEFKLLSFHLILITALEP